LQFTNIPFPHHLLKFQSKVCKYLGIGTCPQFQSSPNLHVGLLGVNLWGTNAISARYLQAEILSSFFETSLEDRKNVELRENIIFCSIKSWEQKLCPNKLNTGERGQQKILAKIRIFFSVFFFHIHYISFYLESFDSFHLDLI